MPSGRRWIVWLWAACGAGLAWAPGGGPRAYGAPRGLPLGVLARIDERRVVTLEEAVGRYFQTRQPTAPDSITPAASRRFLDLLVDEAVLTEAAVREAAPWSPRDSAAHAGLLDRLTLKAALDSTLGETRRREFPRGAEPRADTLGQVARDRVVARLEPAFDDSVVARVAGAFRALPRASADSSLAAQIRALSATPRLEPRVGDRPIVRSRSGTVLAREVTESWSRLSIAVRPRIDSEEQVRDLARNLLFERALRDLAARSRLDTLASVQAAMRRDAERIALERTLDRQVVSQVVPDSAAVAVWFSGRADEFALPRRVRGIRLTLADRAAAVRVAVTLADAAAAETLLVRARKSGVELAFQVDEAADSVLFRRALAAGTGAVVGPVPEGGGFWVARVTEVIPGRPRRLGEVRAEAGERWRGEEIERRTRLLAARLGSSMRVEIAPRAEQTLSRALADRAAHRSDAGDRGSAAGAP